VKKSSLLSAKTISYWRIFSRRWINS